MREILICPSCKQPIAEENDQCKCNVYDADDGIFDLLHDKDVYWGEISKERITKALEEARSLGWRKALEEIAREYPDLKEYLLSSRRIDWIFHCLNPSGSGRCLDIGSGWGSNTFGLAEYFDEVWSLEAVRERIEFQSIRRDQENKKNVKLVRTDWLKLPFPDKSFDLVVCNGILEWIGLSDYSRNPRDLQVQFLKEAHRVLKDGGCIYIGIENRLGYNSFRGTRDHSGLKYTNLMPRVIADLVVRKVRNKDDGYTRDKRVREDWHSYRTYTYTRWGYRKLLADSGFSEPSIYWTGSYNLPKYSGRIDNDSYAFFLKNMKISHHSSAHSRRGLSKDRILKAMPNPLIRLIHGTFSPSFLIYAYKGEKASTLESKMIDQNDGRAPFVKASGSHGWHSKISYFIADKMELSRVVKFARFPSGQNRIEREERMLAKFARVDMNECVTDGIRMYVEPPIDGRALAPRSPVGIRKALDWLIQFQNSTETSRHIPTDAQRDEFKALRSLLKDLSIDEDLMQSSYRQLSEFEERLVKAGLHTCGEHGDFFHDNILQAENGEVVVTDWEYFSDDGIPMFDLVFFLLANATYGVDPSRLEDCVNEQDPYSKIMMEEIVRFANGRNISPELVVHAFPYTMLRAVLRENSDGMGNQFRSEYYSELLRLWFEKSLETSMIERLSKDANHRDLHT